MKLATIFSLALSLFAQAALAYDCPQKIRVEVGSFESFSPTDEQAIEELFRKGASYTDRSDIRAVLEVASRLTSFDETLTYVSDDSSPITCGYRSPSGTRLKLWSQRNHYDAVLRIERINYQFTTSAGGAYTFLELKTPVRKTSPTELVNNRNQSVLGFEMEVRIPAEDYGTERTWVFAEIGYGGAVRYSIVE